MHLLFLYKMNQTIWKIKFVLGYLGFKLFWFSIMSLYGCVCALLHKFTAAFNVLLIIPLISLWSCVHTPTLRYTRPDIEVKYLFLWAIACHLTSRDLLLIYIRCTAMIFKKINAQTPFNCVRLLPACMAYA